MASEFVITIKKGEEYRAKDNDPVWEENTFFAEAYQQARDCLGEIIDISKMAKEDISRQSSTQSDEYITAQLRGCTNNIIAFCADRGHGKTSAMLSFCNALKDLNRDSYRSIRRDNEGEKARAFWSTLWPDPRDIPNFQILDPIDPTTMEDNESILKIIISRIFNRFRSYDMSYCEGRNMDRERKREILIQDFQQCFHDIDVLYSSQSAPQWGHEDALERISELGDSSHLLAAMYKLIQHYLIYIGSERDYLVLQIDDSDVKISKSYQILEDIRKYLMIPNVIIVMSANIVQLESIIEQYFLTEYKEGLKYPESTIDVTRCHEIAGLYLEKAIPNSRRIYLPNLANILREEFSMIRVQYMDPQRDWLVYPEVQNKARDYQEQLLYFLHKKTGLVFLRPKDYLHNILPHNMRELTHFLAFFGTLGDISNSKMSKKDEKILTGYDFILDTLAMENGISRELLRWKYNLSQLEHYVVDLWSITNLHGTQRRLLRDFAHESESTKHGFLLKNLPYYYSYERKSADRLRGLVGKDEKEYQAEFIRACEACDVAIPWQGDGNTRFIAPTYADVVTALDVLRTLLGTEQCYKFAYAVHLYYSIQFHKLLLRDLENEHNARLSLPQFMKDILIKKKIETYKWSDWIYCHTEVNREIANQAFEKETLLQVSTNLVVKRQFLCQSSMGTSIKFKAILAQNETDRIPPIVFNVLYPLLNQINSIKTIRCSNIDLKWEYSQENRNQTHYSKMIVSIIILLNWDVQHELLHTVRTFSPKNEKSRLYQYVTEFYGLGIPILLEKVLKDNPDIDIATEGKLTSAFQDIVFADEAFRKFLNAVEAIAQKKNSTIKENANGANSKKKRKHKKHKNGKKKSN